MLMDKTPKVVIVESAAPASKVVYYFTNQGVFKLEAYSKMLSYFLALCLILLILKYFEGFPIAAIGIGIGMIAFLFAFMILWVYPKERRISQFSLSELKSESSAKKIQWKSISNLKISHGKIAFMENSLMRKGRIIGDPKAAAIFFRSKVGKV
jgi:hypothetical protein